MSFRAEIAGSVDLLSLHRRQPGRYPFLLQSVAGHALTGRYDLLLAFPGEALGGPSFFEALSRAWRRDAVAGTADADLPFVGGWFLLLGYEAARWIEPKLGLPPSPFALPDALAVRCTAAIVYDRARGTTQIYAESDAAQFDRMRRDCDAALQAADDEPLPARVGAAVEEPPERYLAGVRRVLEYLRAGDIFQANLSRAWQAPLLEGDAPALYRRLRSTNPAPFAGLARWGSTTVLSSSPERLLHIGRDGLAETRPIAGTRPRGADEVQDRLMRRRLIESGKERAEHVMLIDLERNDLGRVCIPGSVEVSELMTVETYAHVHHLVSNVRGRLRAGVGPGEALRAVFPGGTITGCPKLRAMEILAELEGVGRGPYTGAMGYLSRCGRLDTNILIRSLVVEDGRITLRTGAGIVADSDPQAELAETRAKARGLLLALEER